MSQTLSTIINVRVDRKTKKEAQKVLEELGLDLSTGIKTFLRNVVLTQSLPLNLRTKNGFTVRQELEMLEEVRQAKKTGKRYKSVDEAMDAI